MELLNKVPRSPQVEIRDGLGVVIVVSCGEGYKYKYYGNHRTWLGKLDPLDEVKGINIHLALNNALQCTFDEWLEISKLIWKARELLGDESIDEA